MHKKYIFLLLSVITNLFLSHAYGMEEIKSLRLLYNRKRNLLAQVSLCNKKVNVYRKIGYQNAPHPMLTITSREDTTRMTPQDGIVHHIKEMQSIEGILWLSNNTLQVHFKNENQYFGNDSCGYSLLFVERGIDKKAYLIKIDD